VFEKKLNESSLELIWSHDIRGQHVFLNKDMNNVLFGRPFEKEWQLKNEKEKKNHIFKP
jgi:hypothetical protein